MGTNESVRFTQKHRLGKSCREGRRLKYELADIRTGTVE